MTARSVRRRLARRPDRPVRAHRMTRPGRYGAGHVQVTVSVVDFATRISQSFLILPGRTTTVLLTGYTEVPGQLPRVLNVPVEITARVA